METLWRVRVAAGRACFASSPMPLLSATLGHLDGLRRDTSLLRLAAWGVLAVVEQAGR